MKKVLWLVLCICTLAGAAGLAASEKIVGGPFTVGVTQSAATVVWLVQSDELTMHPAAGGPGVTSPSFRVETTTLTGLKPDTRYEYAIPSGGEERSGSFKTAPREGTPYRFVVYGDTRTRHDVHRKVISQILKGELPDFILHTGDLVNDGNDSSLWPIFFDVERDLLRQTAFFPALGNHERSARYFQGIFQDDSPYYSFDWGNAHFTIIDSETETVASTERKRNAFWQEQTRWLEDDLENHQKAVFRFLVSHHPPFTAVKVRQGQTAQIAALVPLFEKYRVSAAFFGHDHNYQHYLKNGIHYITTGGGGAPLYDVDVPPDEITQKVAKIENFVSVTVNGGIAHMRATALDGHTLDQFDIKAADR